MTDRLTRWDALALTIATLGTALTFAALFWLWWPGFFLGSVLLGGTVCFVCTRSNT